MGVNGDWEGFGACGWAVYGGVCCYYWCYWGAVFGGMVGFGGAVVIVGL